MSDRPLFGPIPETMLLREQVSSLEQELERLKAENAALRDELKTAYFDSFQPVRWMRP